MNGRLSLLLFVVATGIVHLLPVLPGSTLRIGLLAVIIAVPVLILVSPGWRRKGLLFPIWAFTAGFLLTVVRVDDRLNDALADSNVNLVTRVELRVTSLAHRDSGIQRFDAEVIDSVPDGVPAKIRVSWRTGDWGGPYARSARHVEHDKTKAVIPGQVWRMALVLKPPHGARNPDGFDYESYMFANGVRALGTVRGTPVLLRDEPWHSLEVIAERARHHVRDAMLPYLRDKRYGAVLLALAIGDQASVEAQDWQTFNRTGITHLVSISGSHVTMIAGIGGFIVTRLWRRLRFRGVFLAEYVPAQITGALAALFVAWLYCLLAGWGVPAQRTFLMLAVIAVSYVLRLPLSASRLLLLAAFVVIILDPWAILSSGFWLSFGAVAVLMTTVGTNGRPGRVRPTAWWSRMYAAGHTATRLQLLISAALLPALAFLFHEISIVSPLANAYAIPIVSLLVTPITLLAAFAAVLPGADIFAGWLADTAHVLLQGMMIPTDWLSGLSIASIMAAASPVALTLLALFGLIVVVSPKGMPYRLLGWTFLVPALVWLPARPSEGEWHAVALDVGQASAIVIQTAKHNLLFDTGVRHSPTVDSGSRVIWPYFRSLGINRLDALVVSHADIDHVGGLRGLLNVMHVGQSYSSFSIDQWLRREASMLDIPDTVKRPLAMTACHYGQHWAVDGVTFEMVWPLPGGYSPLQANSRERNDQSCVLRVVGRHHSLLLTGDISATQEKELVHRGIGMHDIVMGAHHGSKGSSDVQFIQAVQARHAVVQAGAWSRYGHPHAATVKRWIRGGATFWRTDRQGAITMVSRKDGLHVIGERQRRPRYWQN